MIAYSARFGHIYLPCGASQQEKQGNFQEGYCVPVEGVLSFEDVSGAEAWVAKREEGGNREGKQAKPGEAPGRATDCRRLRKSAFLYPGWGKTLTSAYVVGKDSKA